jgi:chromosome segregation ATPase
LQVEAQQQNKAGRGLLGRFRKDKGDKDKGGSDKTDKSVAIASSTDAAELAVLREKVSQLKAEIVLHKETKDQLATDLRSAMADFDDQRATIGSTIATLTSENASLKARQKVREARVANGGADDDSEDERERISVDAAEASLRIELHRQVQYLETKCSRAEADAKNHARERELLKADLAKAEVLAASLTSERTTLQSDKVRLNNELSGLISEGHTTSSRLRLAEDEVRVHTLLALLCLLGRHPHSWFTLQPLTTCPPNRWQAANLRVRIAECEAALETETKSTSRAIDRALDAEGTVALVRSDHKQAQIALTQAKAEVALAAATSSSVIEGLRTTNAELSQKLSEHEAKVSVKENRLAALASRLAHGEGDRNVLASGGTPPSMSPVDATDQSGVDTMNRKLSGSLGLIESRILEANRDRDAMSAKLVEQLEARTLFDARIAEVCGAQPASCHAVAL